MKIKYTLHILFFLLVQVCLAQTDNLRELRGKISADSLAVDRITIENVTSSKTVFSDNKGFFDILVKEGDILVFTAVNLEGLRRKINREDLVLDVFLITMMPKSIVLKEVVINKSTISAESQGIIPYGQKKYTPAERKLYTATSGGGIDGLLNTISGRKAMLKKEIIIEKKVQLLDRIQGLFEDKYYLETLKIPQDYIRGFQYYCIDDASFASALRAKNKTMLMFLIVKLAETYNKIIVSENK